MNQSATEMHKMHLWCLYLICLLDLKALHVVPFVIKEYIKDLRRLIHTMNHLSFEETFFGEILPLNGIEHTVKENGSGIF